LDNALQLTDAPQRTPDAPRRREAQSVSPSPSARSHRADTGGAAAASEILTRLAVVLLSSINAVMWEVYTESRTMGALWAIIAIGFVVWIRRDVARR
jgi:hypothetical protein